ncbi:MAG: fumarylacetoacetate hydrolase family protein [Actinomycetota bacterium]|jgi:2-keto-4-pentenoate hydratase/2-oxohepta-3-ene-1,7-dioic acid hydratase in catechol pathway|nr:fumarylacetoacetate hydrolase family protein [Acidimicrobiales bacterium]MED6304692.1 fumarylacetoacetate hydrolase family protein [Actinomycetota bacterium]|tara:strand:- start:796 stop:1632 length:837 start_codon:yes stop_codon:yes gene_type:complete
MPFTFANVNSRACLINDEDFYDINRLSQDAVSADPMIALADIDALHQISGSLGDHEPDGSLSEAKLGPPSPRPRNSFGVGLNYKDHAEESKMDLPESPVIFSKFPSCIVGPFADIDLRATRGDYEAELVVVIGRAVRDVSTDDAWSHVAGVTAGQDISDRKLQLGARPPQFGLGKSRDTYGPTGPLLLSPDSFPDADDLHLTCEINGDLRQDARTRDLIFDVSFLVSYLSEVMTLIPGDLIFTGTPAGVGMPDKRFLVPGDVITTTVDGVGSMVNICR